MIISKYSYADVEVPLTKTVNFKAAYIAMLYQISLILGVTMTLNMLPV